MTKLGSKTGTPSKGGWVVRSGVSGRYVAVHSSFAMPNGDRVTTVRRDIMDRALGRNPEKVS
jgi:hypothetical protein